MKAIPIQQAEGKLGQLIAEACGGEMIVITDGKNSVTLEPGIPMDLAEDSPELAAELLKAAGGPFTPYSTKELRSLCQDAVREKNG